MNYVTTTINNLNNPGLANKTHKISKSAKKRKELSYTGKKNKKNWRRIFLKKQRIADSVICSAIIAELHGFVGQFGKTVTENQIPLLQQIKIQ